MNIKRIKLGEVVYNLVDSKSIHTINGQKADDNGNFNLDIPDTSKLAPLESPNFTGKPLTPTAEQSSNDEQIASTAFVKKAIQSFGGSSGSNIQVSLTQPNNQKTGDFWYKILQ